MTLEVPKEEEFILQSMWHLLPGLIVQRLLVGTTTKRKFPTLTISATVRRKPNFIMYNVCAPHAVLCRGGVLISV